MTNKKGNAYVGVVLIVIALIVVVACFARQKSKELKAEALKEQTTEPVVVETVNLFDLSKAEINPDEIFSFSKTEQNVLVIMLDRAVSQYFPYIMEELPEVEKQFSGFTYYPNTVSFGSSTIFAAAALYGGYEYTPEAINNRYTESLKDKHNEALKVLPTIFSKNGFTVTVCDPPLAGYQWEPDLSIFDDIKGVLSYNIIGKYNEKYGITTANDFLEEYVELLELKRMTNNFSDEGAFIIFENATPHYIDNLQIPDYTPTRFATTYTNNYSYSLTRTLKQGESINLYTDIQRSHYYSLAAALKQLGIWFDYLRKLDVYDNTRIIIVADHGYRTGQNPTMVLGNTDVEYYIPLLIVKDFNSTGDIKTDDTFMTNADVPTLATNGIIKDAKNPYTGNLLSDTVNKSEAHIMRNGRWEIESNLGNTFGSQYYFVVKDDVYDMNNWSIKSIPIDYSKTTTTTKAETTTNAQSTENTTVSTATNTN